MVARLNTGYSIRRTFFYNEYKVREGVARLLLAENYALPTEMTSENYRLMNLLKQASLNEIVARNSVHISLNFDPSENHIDDDKLRLIAREYMQGLDFANQPYLVYRHMDTGHPHLHIVSVKVDEYGEAKNFYFKGKLDPLREHIENKYGLVKANKQQQKAAYEIPPVDPLVVQYGRQKTKQSITNVLDKVLGDYNYCSLPELNAILRQFNVYADEGAEGSRLRKYGGLQYRILAANGQMIGVPIKASGIYSRPTLSELKTHFQISQAERKKPTGQSAKRKLSNSIAMVLNQKVCSMEAFTAELQKKGIYTVLRLSKEGQLYGITYVDNSSKFAFNGGDLLKQYAAKAILDQLEKNRQMATEQAKTLVAQGSLVLSSNNDSTYEMKVIPFIQDHSHYAESGLPQAGLLELLLRPEYGYQGLSPYERKKRKKRNQKKL